MCRKVRSLTRSPRVQSEGVNVGGGESPGRIPASGDDDLDVVIAIFVRAGHDAASVESPADQNPNVETFVDI